MMRSPKRNPGTGSGDISFKLQDGAESHGFSVLQSFAGHGIGRNLHEAPEIPLYGGCWTRVTPQTRNGTRY